MHEEQRIDQQKQLVEELGRHFDKEGFQPIAGRILGLLMVMDKEQFTFEAIVEELQISKASASHALKNLEIRGNIEYITLPGDRKRYFQLKKYDAFHIIDDFKSKAEGFQDFLGRIIGLKADKKSSNVLFYQELIGILHDFIQKVEELRKDYEKKYSNQ